MTGQLFARKVGAIAIAAGGILYASWFVQWVVPTNLSAMSSYISELSASNQPHHLVFRATDLAAGMLLIVGSTAALLSTIRSRWAVTGWVSLLLFGASTIADSQSPLPCAATADPHCDHLSDLGQLGWADSLHTFTSAGEDLFFGLTMLSLMIVAWRIGVPIGLRRAATAIAIGIVLAWAWTLGAAAEFELHLINGELRINDQLGVAQRTEVSLIGVWLVLVAIGLLRSRPGQRLTVPDSIN
ncbi:MAG: DUF998 domain-containing protein [Aeromicrobium sp.]